MFKYLPLIFALAIFTQAFPLFSAETVKQEVKAVHSLPPPLPPPSSILADADVQLNSALQAIQKDIKEFVDKYSTPDLLPVLGEPGIVIPSAVNALQPVVPEVSNLREGGDGSTVH